jgi:hypothetical protein
VSIRAAGLDLGRRLAAGALVVGVAAAVTLLGPAPAAEAAACSGTSGVTVVVDYGSLGGGVRVSCAAGDPTSGLAALSGAGFSYSFVPRLRGLVCQINAQPDPCNGAPANAYWSYWHAERGDSWSYSTSGAGSYNPRAGTVEGWAFGAGARPGIAPPAPAAAPPPAPAPEPSPTSRPSTRAPAPPPAPAPGVTSAPGAPPRSGGAGPVPGGTATTARTTSRPSGTPAAPPTDPASGSPASGSPASGGAPPDAAAPPAGPATEPVSASRGLATTALGTVVVAAVALAGFLVARRRRSPAA